MILLSFFEDPVEFVSFGIQGSGLNNLQKMYRLSTFLVKNLYRTGVSFLFHSCFLSPRVSVLKHERIVYVVVHDVL